MRIGGQHGSQGEDEAGRDQRNCRINGPRYEAASMLCLTRPSDDRIRRFLARQRGLPYSYPDAGASPGEPPAGEVTITNWGGTLHVVTARFRRARSLRLIATRPLARETTLVETIVFVPNCDLVLLRGRPSLLLVGGRAGSTRIRGGGRLGRPSRSLPIARQ